MVEFAPETRADADCVHGQTLVVDGAMVRCPEFVRAG